ncbi:choline transporter-like protein 1 [Styela clava]
MGCCYSAARSGGKPPPKPSKWEPLEKRTCTDIVPLTFFVIFFVGMILIAAFSIASGAASRLINGYDSYGNICNQVNKKIVNSDKSGLDLRGKKYVFFMDVMDPPTSLEICVEKCPDRELETMQDVKKFFDDTGSQLCDYQVDPDQYHSQASSKYGPCPVLPVRPSSSVLFRCVPDDLPDFLSDLVKIVYNVDFISLVLRDIYMSRYAIIGLCFLAVLVAFIMVILIRYVASIVVYIILVLVCVASIGGTVLLWWTYASPQGIEELNIKLNEANNSQAFLWYAIAATVLTVFLLLLILVMRKRVAITVDLFYEAGKCMTRLPCLLMQPFWTFIILLLFWMCWVVIFAFLATSGEPYLEDPHTGWVKYNETSLIRYSWWYHLVGLIWISEFILACQQMTIAGSIATYYFTRNKSQLGDPILSSIGRLISNHLGSCALGSFIITLVKIPRCILMYIHSQLSGSENMCAKVLLKMCICCLYVFERCLKYLNYNAYTLVAVNGTHFCKSACDAVATLMSNALRVIAINSVGTFILFLGKLLVVAITAGIGGVVVMRFHPNLTYIAAPVGIVAIFAYLIAHCFLSIYEMAIDTLLLCFCEDCRVNDGTPGREYFMSKSLMAYVKKSTRHLDEVDGKKPKEGPEGVPLNESAL